MVKKIVKDPLFLAQKSVDATEADKQVVIDLLDTLRANLDHCDYKEVLNLSDRGRMSVAGGCPSLHQISGDRGGLPRPEL